MRRCRHFSTGLAVAVAAALIAAGCGGNGPSGPTPPPGGGNNQQPPANNQPVIESLAVRNARPRAPANFADVSDTIEVTAQVRDDETAAAQLQFQWSATNGTFSGTGATVTWTPDASAATPLDVTITLRVVERY
jgi:polyisoprenoid-binding protein YceI